MTSLHKVLKDAALVAAPSTPFGPVEERGVEFPRCYPGPNTWDSIQPEDFGADFDYTAVSLGTRTVITPYSPAALQWLYRHLPEDCPRYSALGFCIETEHVQAVTDGMKRDGLVEHDEAMANEERDRHAGEDR